MASDARWRDGPGGAGGALWLAVAAAFAAQVAVFGALYTFGVVLDDVGRDLGVGRGAVGLVPSVAAAALFLLGPLSGRIADRWGAAPVVAAGALLLPAGLLLVAAARTVPLAVVGFGLVAGAAASCVYVPSVAAIAGRAGPGRPLPAGVVVAGVGTGTAVVAPVLRELVDAVGWRWAYRWYAVAAAAVLLSAAAVLARQASGTGRAGGSRGGHPRARRAAGPTADGRRPGHRTVTGPGHRGTFARLYGALLLASPSMYAGLLFLASDAEAHGLAGGRRAALVSTFGLAGTAARVVVAAAGRRLPVASVFRMTFVLLAVSLPVWALADGRFAALAVYALVAGTGYGGLIGLAPTVTAARFGVDGLAGRLGLLYTSLGLGGLVTGPVVGAALDSVGATPTMAVLCGLTTVAVLVVPGPARAST